MCNVSKVVNLQLYWSVIIPVVTYGCETWTLEETITNRLMVFDRNVLRKIFGPINENGIWRIKTNQELDKIIKHQNIENKDWDGLVIWKECKKQEWSKQYTPGDPFQKGQ
jgi:hypothetical protein